MYHYEALGDERFQELCQALIAVQNPDAQCLPVGQPDGGRDAFLYRHIAGIRGSTADVTVFQVKFSRSNVTDKIDRDMISDIIKSEKHKIQRLKSFGLKKYILLTNVKGTAHFQTGSIDKVNEELSRALGIDAYCWWRDDLDRRLDSASDIKWSYPDILKATDLLEVLVKGQLGEDEDRRRGAVRAYLTAQYDDDKELKFKQTDLRTTMTDLFVDLPMSASAGVSADDQVSASPSRYYRRSAHTWYRETRHAAEFLLTEFRPSQQPRVLLEGAPGQGKSTVTQYVCQLLRMLMLDKHMELSALPKNHRTFMARLPFRVDLRDLAKWLGGTDPFQSKPVPLDDREPRSLEGFLAAQVRHNSGGAAFNVSDLIAVAKASHLLLALDGFDEVADVAMRNTLVTEISKGTSRLLSAGGFSVQTIVTSRPAAFAKSVRFPRDSWAYYELLPLERAHVDAYTEKWMRAKALKAPERQALVRVLSEKLEEAHTQYLAKNPMQLTILLSLINNRGSSLPEKRTAMYDAYMDMFFSRESEKSDIVRDNRELLIDIHRYLAWKLQTGAESGGDGSIEYGELRSTLFSYLDSQSEDTSIVNSLFNGIIERVGALVSRVQETYEFEVQPLREYFAARHLYETAPYSPANDEQRGTKLDRFQALIQNPYWLNVARFYGGCFSKGEVSALVDELTLIAATGEYCQTSHPRQIALMFLSDWVFTQYQPAVKRIVSLICDYPELRRLLASEQLGNLNWSPLPERSGRQDFVNRMWGLFSKSTKSDERAALSVTLSAQLSSTERTSLWSSLSADRTVDELINLAEVLGAFKTDAEGVLNNLPLDLPHRAIHHLMSAGRFDLITKTAQRQRAATDDLLNGRYNVRPVLHRFSQSGSSEYVIASIITLYQYGLPFNDNNGGPLYHAIANRSGRKKDDILSASLASEESDVVQAYRTFTTFPTNILSSSMKPWSDLIECLRNVWGDCTAVDRIAVLGAGVRARGEGGSAQPLETTNDLVGTFRYLRMKSGAPQWWLKQLQAVNGTPHALRYLLVLLVWGTAKTLVALSNEIDILLRRLSPDEWDTLRIGHNFCRAYSSASQNAEWVDPSTLAKISRLGGRAATVIGSRLTPEARYRLVAPILSDEQSMDPELGFALDTVYRSLRERPNWTPMLQDMRALYARGASLRLAARREDFNIPIELASQIASDPEAYPLLIVGAADTMLKSHAGEDTPKLSDVAKLEGWFQ